MTRHGYIRLPEFYSQLATTNAGTVDLLDRSMMCTMHVIVREGCFVIQVVQQVEHDSYSKCLSMHHHFVHLNTSFELAEFKLAQLVVELPQRHRRLLALGEEAQKVSQLADPRQQQSRERETVAIAVQRR